MGRGGKRDRRVGLEGKGGRRKGLRVFLGLWVSSFSLFFLFFLFQHTSTKNKSNQNNATQIHIYLIYKYKQLPFSYTKFPVKRIIVGKILNYEKIVD
jgi:hypothetical protein